MSNEIKTIPNAEHSRLAVPLGEESLAAGLRTMIDNPEQRAALTSRLAEVRKELSWEEPIRQTEATYKNILMQNNAVLTDGGVSG